MCLITSNKVKKTQANVLREKKYKGNKRILRNLSFDNNSLVKP